MEHTRRNLLVNATGIVSGLAIGSYATLGEKDIGEPPDRKIKVIVCGGHPGDPEYGCGGTVAQLTKFGHEVVLLYLNDGGWPPTSSTERMAEAKKACEILKARAAY